MYFHCESALDYTSDKSERHRRGLESAGRKFCHIVVSDSGYMDATVTVCGYVPLLDSDSVSRQQMHDSCEKNLLFSFADGLHLLVAVNAEPLKHQVWNGIEIPVGIYS